jgi:tellurium resistance protein TerD
MVDDILDTRFEGKEVDLSGNHLKLGDEVNLALKDPALRNLHVGIGWDLNAFDADVIDLDVSIFLLNKNDLTRVDEDFIFYNNLQDAAGAVKHMGDSRTGAGDGDDESISIDLHGVTFDVYKIVFVISIYRGEEKHQSLKKLQNAFIRLVNKDTNIELCRYELSKHLEDRLETAMIVGILNREGPKWHFLPKADFFEAGLGAVATKYGCIITQS